MDLYLLPFVDQSDDLCLLTLGVEQFECKGVLVQDGRRVARFHLIASGRIDMRPPASDGLAVLRASALIVRDVGARAFDS